MVSDADLVRQTRAGRTLAYEELVRRWAGRIIALCHARVRNGHVAEELTQETLLRGFRAIHTLKDPDRFGAWLCGIALRACLDWQKSPQNQLVRFSDLDVEHDPERYLPAGRPESDSLEREDERCVLLGEVDRLPEECRQVLLMYYYQDHTYRDLAQILGVSTATVNARLTRARKLLRARLEACGRSP
jgi:RNA polymerase sigma-70 factor (ECF subfamily)